jgi:hypothetical protein
MARTALTPVALARDNGVAQGAGATPDATNGNTVAVPGPFNAIIMVKNADASSHNLIVRAAGYTGTPAGAANSGLPLPQNTVFTQGTLGDLTVAVAASATEIIKITTSSRFVQNDGSMLLDWSASTSMTVWVLVDPFVAV